MSLMTSLFAHLTAKAGIAELIDSRLYPQIAPPDSPKPHSVYYRPRRSRQPHSGGSSGLVTDAVVISHYAETYGGADAVAEAFRNELDGLSRVRLDDAVDVSVCRLLDERDTLDPIEFGQSDAPHFVRQEYEITYSETLPTL